MAKPNPQNIVDPQNPSLKNSPIVDTPVPGEAAAAGTICVWNNAQYSPGGFVCVAKPGSTQYLKFTCIADGTWHADGTC